MASAYCSFSVLALISSLPLLLISLCVGAWQVERADFLVISGNHIELSIHLFDIYVLNKYLVVRLSKM